MRAIPPLGTAIRSRGLRTAAIVLSAAVVGGGTVAVVDGRPEAAPPAEAPASSARLTPVAATTGAAAVDFSDVYARRRAGVVSISATVQAAGGPGVAPGAGTAAGSGVVIDHEGHILTNEHVVDGASAIEVELGDGTVAPATLVGTDPSTDLAVLRIDVPADGLAPIPLGDSSAIEVGDAVLAVGDPFGYQASASAGIVSGLDRSMQAPNGFTITGAIQTDAAVNHGNSGGALLDAAGELIGIPAQIADSGVDANVGVAFAIPSATAERVIADLLADGEVEHAWLGVGTADAAGLPGVGARSGALVTGVVASGPADDAGIEGGDRRAEDGGDGVCVGGDVITAVGETPVTDAADLQEAIDAADPGSAVALTVVAPDGRSRTVSVTLGTRPSSAGQATTTAACAG